MYSKEVEVKPRRVRLGTSKTRLAPHWPAAPELPITMQRPSLARAVPIAFGLVVLVGGLLQFTPWKARHLACCSEPPLRADILPPHSGSALRHGLRLGLHCTQCCVGLILILRPLSIYLFSK